MNIKFEKLDFEYSKKNKVLKNINFEIKKNEIIFIMGKNGAGKSTLAKHFNFLLKPKNGEIIYKGKEGFFKVSRKTKIKNPNQIRKNFGLLFQFPEHQLFEYSVLKDVEFGIKNMYPKNKNSIKKAKETLKSTFINEKIFSKSPFTLSRGQKRKVALCGAIAYDPNFLILDEPTVGLDFQNKEEIIELIKKNKKTKKIIIISHDLDLCYELADRVIYLEKGEIVFDGDPKSLFSRKEFKNTNYLPFMLKVEKIVSENKDLRKKLGEIKNV